MVDVVPKVIIPAVGHLSRHFEKMTLKLKSEPDMHPVDESGPIVRLFVVVVSL